MNGRRLDVTSAPPDDFVSAWLAVRDEVPRQAWSRMAIGEQRRPELPCRIADSTTSAVVRVWVTHHDQEYRGEPADRLLLTAREADAALLRPGNTVDMDIDGGSAQHRWEPAGYLTAAVPTPAPLTAELTAIAGWPPTDTTPEALDPWEAPIRSCAVTSDGRHLRLSGVMGWGEVLAKVDLTETSNTIGVRAHIGIDPALRQLPRTAANRGFARPAVAVRWRSKVNLAEPLADRPVLDLANAQKVDRQQAWRNWRSTPPSSGA